MVYNIQIKLKMLTRSPSVYDLQNIEIPELQCDSDSDGDIYFMEKIFYNYFSRLISDVYVRDSEEYNYHLNKIVNSSPCNWYDLFIGMRSFLDSVKILTFETSFYYDEFEKKFVVEAKNYKDALKKSIKVFVGEPTKFKGCSKECPVCFEEINKNNLVYELDCNHTFHKKCLSKWLVNKIPTKKLTCPMCRKECRVKNYKFELNNYV